MYKRGTLFCDLVSCEVKAEDWLMITVKLSKKGMSLETIMGINRRVNRSPSSPWGAFTVLIHSKNVLTLC